jgi:hypothetical protein
MIWSQQQTTQKTKRWMMIMKWLTNEELNELKNKGFETSSSYDTEEEAIEYAKYLKELSKDPSQIVSVVGLYAHLDHYPQVVYKHTVSFS